MSIHGLTKTVTDSSFQTDVIEAKGLTLVDFWATWCVPCKSIAPKLDEISKELAGQFTLAKVNIEENHTTPASYDVRSIPTLVLFKNGKPIDRMIGNHSQKDIKNFIEKHIE